MNNNEMQIVSELLSDPSLATSIDLDSRWFDNQALGTFVEAINRLKGSNYTLEQVYREVRTINLMAGTLEEIEILASNANGGDVEQMAENVHADYLDRELAITAQNYAIGRSVVDLDRLQRLTEERQEMALTRSDGNLQSAFVEFSQSLEQEPNIVETYKPIDDLLGGGVSGGKLIIVAGRPATGKTAFALNICEQMFEKNENVACDFFTLEMGQNELMTRLISKKTRINSMLFLKRNALSPENRKKAKIAYMDMLQRYDLKVYTSEFSKLNSIRAAIKKNHKRNKRYIAFVDYAGLITVTDSRKNERQVMNEVTRELKKLTTDLNITIFLLSQLSRAVEGRADGKPMLSDLKESGSLEQDANVVMLLSADKDKPEKICCDVAKNREGMTGTAPFIFNKKFMDFSIDFDIWRG